MSQGTITRFAKNTGILFISSLFISIANLGVSFSIGNVCGSVALGIYAFTVALTRVLLSASEMGIGTHLIKRISREQENANKCVKLIISMRLLLLPIIVTIVVISSMLVGVENLPAVILIATSLAFLSIGTTHEALLTAKERFPHIGAARILYTILLVTGILLWFAAEGDLQSISILLLAVALINLFVYWLFGLKLEGFWPGWVWDPIYLYDVIKKSLPIGISAMLAIATLKTPILVLTISKGVEPAGRYAAVEMFVVAMTMIQLAVSRVSFPALSRNFNNNPKSFRKWLLLSNIFLAFVGIIFALVFTLFGGQIVSIFFPQRTFGSLGDLAAIMGWASPMILLIHHNIYIFAAANLEVYNMKLMILGFVATALFVSLLAPAYGIIGVGVGIVTSRFLFLLIVLYVGYRNKVHLGTSMLTAN